MISRSEERIVLALQRAKDETGLPLFVEMEMSGGKTLYRVLISVHSLTPETPRPINRHRLTQGLPAGATATFLDGLRLGWLYGSGKLKLYQKPPTKEKAT